MNDNFDVLKWKRELILRNNSLNEVQNPLETKIQLELELSKIFPNVRYFSIYLPLPYSDGKITIGMKKDISKEDLVFVEDMLSKLGFKLDLNKSQLYYDIEPGERKYYPTLSFIYL